MSTRLVDGSEVRAAVPIREAIAAIRHAFEALRAGEFEMPVRTALGSGAFLSMSAHHEPTRTAVVKSISVALHRRPAVAGSVAWLSLEDSEGLILDAAAVTSLRTGAVVGLATDVLAPADAAHLVLIGLGAQAPDQLRAVRAVRRIRRVTLIDPNAAARAAFAASLRGDLDDIDVHVGTDPRTAVGDADVVCCSTPSTVPLLSATDLPAHVHINAIGAFRKSMRELDDDVLGSALVVVDQLDAALEESGEIDHAIRSGTLTDRDLVELSTVLDGLDRPARTVFKSVGLAIQDWAIANAVARRLGS